MGVKKIVKCSSVRLSESPRYAVICLPGRSGHGIDLASRYADICTLPNTVFVGPTPENLEWYPLPKGANDQNAALGGLPDAVTAVERIQQTVQDLWGINKSRTVLVGFSAGGVTALEATAQSKEPYAGCIVHSGAMLNLEHFPSMLPENNNTNVLLTHFLFDRCFDYAERFMPMRSQLVRRGYTTYEYLIDREDHDASDECIEEAKLFLLKRCKFELEEQEIITSAWKQTDRFHQVDWE